MNHSLNAYLTLHYISLLQISGEAETENGLHLCRFVLFRQCLKCCPRVASVNMTNVVSVLNIAERFYQVPYSLLNLN